jgi:cytochrome P450
MSPAAVDRATPEIESIVTAAIDAFIDRGAADLVQEFCEVVPAMTTMKLMGVPVADW